MTDALRSWQDNNPLRRWRVRERLSLSAAAVTLGVSRMTAHSWETGDYRPGWESTYRIANAMGMKEAKLRSLWMKWLAEKPANEAA